MPANPRWGTFWLNLSTFYYCSSEGPWLSFDFLTECFSGLRQGFRNIRKSIKFDFWNQMLVRTVFYQAFLQRYSLHSTYQLLMYNWWLKVTIMELCTILWWRIRSVHWPWHCEIKVWPIQNHIFSNHNWNLLKDF